MINKQDLLKDYTQWLMRIWNPDQLHIPFAENAPQAYISYMDEHKPFTLSVQDLKSAFAAYKAALEYDVCPEPEIAKKLANELETGFSEQDFISGAEIYKGFSPSDIMSIIMSNVEKIEL